MGDGAVATAGAMLAASLLAASLLAALGACGVQTGGDAADADVDGLTNRECTPTIGDLDQPVEVRPVYVDHHGEVHALEGGAVGLLQPIQGGHVLMVGLEARNIRGCLGMIAGTLRDPASGAALATEERFTQLLVGEDGWGHLAFPPIATSANLTTCPMNGLTRDIDGSTWRLELAITDDRGRSGAWAGDVVPFCPTDIPDLEACPCQCDADWVFGEPCAIDPAR